jgi:putative salt-induced outer membrane protein YdiY
MRIHFGISLCVVALSAGCASPGGKQPTTRPSDYSDWVQLTSGEWLKGRIKSMQDWELDIDSDKLYDLSIDWDDVKEVHMSQATILYGDKKTATGALTVGPDTITVSGPTPVQVPRSQLLGISAGENNERRLWTGDVNLGVTLRRGNTNETEITSTANAQRRTAVSRFTFTYAGNYDLISGAKTTDNQRVDLSIDRLITPKFYIRPFDGEYYRDIPLNIENRATLSAGAGYFFFDQPKLEWDVYVGPAYQYLKFVNTEPGTSGETSTAAVVFQTNFKKKKITRYIDVFVNWQGILTSQDAGLFTQQLVGTVRYKITHVLHVDLSLTWNRTEQPKPDSSGHTPKRDDLQTVLTFGFEF